MPILPQVGGLMPDITLGVEVEMGSLGMGGTCSAHIPFKNPLSGCPAQTLSSPDVLPAPSPSSCTSFQMSISSEIPFSTPAA